MSTPHIFRPLDEDKREIRLIHLESILPAGADGGLSRIEAHISYTSLLSTEHTKYTALSYVWGEKRFVSSVVLDDGSHIPITQNLLIALEHIFANGFAPNGLSIWIDGLCINQSDDVEKSWQVQQMQDVYAGAEKTFIFLGPRSEVSDAAIDMFHSTGLAALQHECIGTFGFHTRVAKRFVEDYLDTGPKDCTDPNSPPPERFLNDVMKGGFTHDYMPNHLVSDIMERAWWCRIWVLQELLISRRPLFICGLKQIQADRLIASMNIYALLRAVWMWSNTLRRRKSTHWNKVGEPYLWTDPTDYDGYPAIRLSMYKLASQNPIKDYMRLMRLTHERHTQIEPMSDPSNSPALWKWKPRQRMQASDPRDYVFPLMTLASSFSHQPLGHLVDYSRSVVDVYVRTTSDFLKVGYSGILLLASYQQTRSRIEGLPSWVPDWSGNIDSKDFLGTDNSNRATPITYLSSGDGSHELSISGRSYGQLQLIWNELLKELALSDVDDSVSKLRYASALGQLLSQVARESPKIESYYDQMARSMFCAMYRPGRSSVSYLLNFTGQTEANAMEDEHVRCYILGLHGEFDYDRETFVMIHDHWVSAIAKAVPELESTSERHMDMFFARTEAISDSIQKKEALRQWHSFKEWVFPRRSIITNAQSVASKYKPFVCHKYVGLASMEVEDGDVLAEIDCDANYLFILRDAGEGRYKIAGDAVVGQLWNWEALDEDRGTRTTFRIC